MSDQTLALYLRELRFPLPAWDFSFELEKWRTKLFFPWHYFLKPFVEEFIGKTCNEQKTSDSMFWSSWNISLCNWIKKLFNLTPAAGLYFQETSQSRNVLIRALAARIILRPVLKFILREYLSVMKGCAKSLASVVIQIFERKILQGFTQTICTIVQLIQTWRYSVETCNLLKTLLGQ